MHPDDSVIFPLLFPFRWCSQELQDHFEESDKNSFDQTNKQTEKLSMPMNLIPNVLISDIAPLARGDLKKKKIDFLFCSMGCCLLTKSFRIL